MIPDLSGLVITRAAIDWSLNLWTDAGWTFVISAPVLVTGNRQGQVVHEELDVAVEPSPLPPPLASLQGAQIVNVLVARQGHLAILLRDCQIVVSPSPWEAWQIVGPGGERLICDADGKLVHFAGGSPHPLGDQP